MPRRLGNKDYLTGQMSPLTLKEICAVRIRLQSSANSRDLAMFNLTTDSTRRACDLTKSRVRDVGLGTWITPRPTAMQQKTRLPVQFEITEPVENWSRVAGQEGHHRTQPLL